MTMDRHGADGRDRIFVVDSQVHIWQASTPERPWPPGMLVPGWAANTPTVSGLIGAMDAAGVDRAILVPPSFEGDRNDVALAASAAYPQRFAVMGRVSLDRRTGTEALRLLRDSPGALGIRMSMFLPQHRPALLDDSAEWLWAAAERDGLPIMILPDPEDLDAVSRLARRHPGLRLTIDHLAVGYGQRDEQAFAHIGKLAELAGLPNISVKASGLPDYSTRGYPYRNLHPYVQAVVEAFGPKRVFWGTDLTRMSCTYREAVTMFTEEIPWLSQDDLSWIMGRGIAGWLKWPLPGEAA
jgi:predicted TIM-barrel fold metal-dependent hydrolase